MGQEHCSVTVKILLMSFFEYFADVMTLSKKFKMNLLMSFLNFEFKKRLIKILDYSINLQLQDGIKMHLSDAL